MKKILFILIVTIASLNAKPCITDIYFGNGVWNDREDAIDNRHYLKKFMLYKTITRLDPSKNKKDYRFRYIHNPSHGVIDDLIETFWQLYQSGQISYPYFYNQSAMLSVATGDITKNEIWEKINAAITDYNNDIVTMLHKYQEESFDQKHNVLLVAHSQGNLFGNKMYTMLTDKQKQKFRMVSVATPAYYVKVPGQTSPYVTVTEDPVINIIPNALDGNVDGIGHEFVSTYLVGSINAPRKIALHIKSAYDNLMQTTSCAQYDFTRVWMPTFGLLNVYGSVDGVDELVGEITLEQSDAILDNSTGRYSCPKGSDSVYWGDDNYIGNNWTYNYIDDRYNSWIPGQYITSRSYLDDISYTNDTVRKDTKCVTLSLNEDGDLYKIISDMFPE